MYRLGPCIPILGRFFIIENTKKMCICVYVNILFLVLILLKNVSLGLKKGISKLLC